MITSNSSSYEHARREALNARRDMKSAFDRLASNVSKSPRIVKDELKHQWEEAILELSPAERIRRHPKSAVTGAFVAGALVGMVLPSRNISAKAVGGLNLGKARQLFSQASEKLTSLSERSGIPYSAGNDSRKMAVALASQLIGGIISKLLAEHVQRREDNISRARPGAGEF